MEPLRINTEAQEKMLRYLQNAMTRELLDDLGINGNTIMGGPSTTFATTTSSVISTRTLQDAMNMINSTIADSNRLKPGKKEKESPLEIDLQPCDRPISFED